MIEVKRRRNEPNSFDVSGYFADTAAHKTLLDATAHLPSVRLYLSGLTSGNSTALSHFVRSLERKDYPAITHCEVSDYWLRCLNLVPQMFRPEDSIESMVLPLHCGEVERDEILFVGKDIPLQHSYEGFEYTTVFDGQTFELGVHAVLTFEVLTRMEKNARSGRSSRNSRSAV
jgi:hypothetical protein